MALTVEQEQELQQLQTERGTLVAPEIGQQIGQLEEPSVLTNLLGPNEQEELRQLKQEKIGLLKKAQGIAQVPRSLIQGLGSTGPLDPEPAVIPQASSTDPLGIQKTAIDQRAELATRRGESLTELRKSFSDEQIQNAFNINRLEQEDAGIDLTEFIPTAIGTVAGIAAGLATGGPDPTDIATVPFVARTVANLIRSGATSAGTFGGEILRQKVTGEEIDFRKATGRGLEEGLIDFGTGTVIDKVGKFIAPFRQSIIPEAQAFADDFARVGKELGEDIPFRITPAQLTAEMEQ
ncbi:MAG TPA: hypothetical protein ENI23_08380 [bacterium]|nr:hypothetical protein [bacterium]